MISFLLRWFFKGIHLCFSFLSAFGAYFTNNILFLTMIIAYNTVLLTLWYLYGYCLFTPIENYLEGMEGNTKNPIEDTSKEKSFIAECFQSVFGPDSELYIQRFFIFTPVICTFVALIKINMYHTGHHTIQTILETEV
jgi:hypothetical protein